MVGVPLVGGANHRDRVTGGSASRAWSRHERRSYTGVLGRSHREGSRKNFGLTRSFARFFCHLSGDKSQGR
jgi:hypothetical protein